jgi:hypothetical protein
MMRLGPATTPYEPARPCGELFRDQNRRDIGRSQSIWTAEDSRWGAHDRVAAGEGFAVHDHVCVDVEELLRAARGQPEAGVHLVKDEEDPRRRAGPVRAFSILNFVRRTGVT